jgi:hypothetical protein
MFPLDRRQLLRGLGAVGTLGLLADPARSQDKPARDLIAKENENAGTTDWQLTYVRTDGKQKLRSRLIEGYCSRTSVNAGDKISFFVSTDPASDYVLDIYRLGYYQGKGGRHLLSLGPVPGKVQPTPEMGEQRLHECKWTDPIEFTIPREWVSGVYLGKLSATKHRYQSYVIFIVRDSRPADFLFQCSDNTWQAYNVWPDKASLYHNDRTDGKVLVSGVKVSFDRPYARYPQILDNPLSQGSGEFLLWEFPLAFWMEQQGYDVTYCSNVDVHTEPAFITRCKSFLSVGHDEYWSRDQYDHIRKAIQAGVHVAWFSANTCCFVAPYSGGERIITRAGRYGGIRPAERAYMTDLPLEGPNEATIIGAQTVSPFNGSGDWTVTKPDHWLFEGTGMKKGEAIPGLVGWEFHGEPADIPGLEVVAEGTTINGADKEARYAATIYTGPKGNLIFNAATIWWAQGLSQPPGHMPPISHYGRPHGPDERVRRITRNLFARFLR